MRLRVLSPTDIEVDEEVQKVIAETSQGAYCLLPRHADFVAPLAPGVLLYEAGAGEAYVAVNGGTLVKCADEVLVSTVSAVAGRDLGQMRQAVEESFENVSERERRAESALKKIEADFVRRFIELQAHE